MELSPPAPPAAASPAAADVPPGSPESANGDAADTKQKVPLRGKKRLKMLKVLRPWEPFLSPPRNILLLG